MSPLSRRRLLGTVGVVGVSGSAAVATVLNSATTPSPASTPGGLRTASSDPTALASPGVIGRTHAFNKPTAFIPILRNQRPRYLSRSQTPSHPVQTSSFDAPHGGALPLHLVARPTIPPIV